MMTRGEAIDRLRQVQREIEQVQHDIVDNTARNRLQIARLDIDEAIKHLDKEDRKQNKVEAFTYEKRANYQ